MFFGPSKAELYARISALEHALAASNRTAEIYRGLWQGAEERARKWFSMLTDGRLDQIETKLGAMLEQ